MEGTEFVVSGGFAQLVSMADVVMVLLILSLSSSVVMMIFD